MSWSSDASPSRHWLSRRRTALPPTLCATLGATTLAACVSGPNFIAPASPPDGGFAAAPLPNLDHGDQRLDSGHGSRAEWWKMLSSPHLDALEDRAGVSCRPSLTTWWVRRSPMLSILPAAFADPSSGNAHWRTMPHASWKVMTV